MEGCGVLRWPSGRSAKVEWQDLYLKRTRGPDDRRERLVLAELLEKTGEGDFLRAVAEAVLQLLMETDVEGLIGAGRYERSGERTTWRNGYRERTLIPGSGALQLRIPKLRQGSYFPPFLEARKSSEKALIAVIQEAWIGGVSTRRVDDLEQAMGLSGISKSQVPSCARACPREGGGDR
jgi:putative transposase